MFLFAACVSGGVGCEGEWAGDEWQAVPLPHTLRPPIVHWRHCVRVSRLYNNYLCQVPVSVYIWHPGRAETDSSYFSSISWDVSHKAEGWEWYDLASTMYMHVNEWGFVFTTCSYCLEMKKINKRIGHGVWLQRTLWGHSVRSSHRFNIERAVSTIW